MKAAARIFSRGAVLDTGPLLIHSFSMYQKGRKLSDVRADIPPDRLSDVLGTLREIFRVAQRLWTTSYVLAEFEVLARERGRLDQKAFRRFVLGYQPYLSRLYEHPIPIQELTTAKGEFPGWHLCFTDTALLLTAKTQGLPLLTLDTQLQHFAGRVGVKAVHLTWEPI